MEKELSRAHHYAYQPKNEDSTVNDNNRGLKGVAERERKRDGGLFKREIIINSPPLNLNKPRQFDGPSVVL